MENLADELDNPELEDLFAIVERVIRTEALSSDAAVPS